MVVFLYNTVIYVFLLLYLCILSVWLFIFIVPTGTLRLPWQMFLHAFSSVVRKMPGYNSPRRSTARTLPNIFVLFCVFFVLCCSVYCWCVNVYCYTDTLCANIRTVPGSIPADATGFFSDILPSDRTMALGSNQPLVKMSTRNIYWGLRRPVRKADHLTTFTCRMSWKSGSLKLLETSGPHRACYGTALPLLLPPGVKQIAV
jgi:hypothetical protein